MEDILSKTDSFKGARRDDAKHKAAMEIAAKKANQIIRFCNKFFLNETAKKEPHAEPALVAALVIAAIKAGYNFKCPPDTFLAMVATFMQATYDGCEVGVMTRDVDASGKASEPSVGFLSKAIEA